MWLANLGRYEDALHYAALFWPAFVEVDGCVLLGSKAPDTLGDWQAKFAGDRVSVEAMLNHRHIHDLFLRAPEPTPQVTQELGLLLRDMWTAKLARDFPGREFVVTVSEGDDPEITFYAKRRDG